MKTLQKSVRNIHWDMHMSHDENMKTLKALYLSNVSKLTDLPVQKMDEYPARTAGRDYENVLVMKAEHVLNVSYWVS